MCIFNSTLDLQEGPRAELVTSDHDRANCVPRVDFYKANIKGLETSRLVTTATRWGRGIAELDKSGGPCWRLGLSTQPFLWAPSWLPEVYWGLNEILGHPLVCVIETGELEEGLSVEGRATPFTKPSDKETICSQGKMLGTGL